MDSTNGPIVEGQEPTHPAPSRSERGADEGPLTSVSGVAQNKKATHGFVLVVTGAIRMEQPWPYSVGDERGLIQQHILAEVEKALEGLQGKVFLADARLRMEELHIYAKEGLPNA